MTIPLSPQITLTPNSFSSGGTQITAAVSVMNRPAYHGKPKITGLTTITPKITCSRIPTGYEPFHIMCSAELTTCDGDASDYPYMHLHYEWDFGDSTGTETATDHWNGETVNLNRQYGPEASYLYRNAGTYTITLTVKGKDENGTVITATTSTLLVTGQHYVTLGKATSGTYVLSFNGNQTAAIAYDATIDQIITALRLVTGLNSTNCYKTHTGSIVFGDDLVGTSYTFTIDSSGLSGTVYTPSIRTEFVSTTASAVTVSDLSSFQKVYVDSNYAGGGSDGTFSAPYTDLASATTFITGGSQRVLYIARGSVLTFSSRIKWAATQSNIRIMTYGTGADPILNETTTTGQFQWEMTYGTVSTVHSIMRDFLFSGINIVCQAYTTAFYIVYSTNGTSGYPYAQVSDIVLDNVTWSSTKDNTSDSSPMQSTCSHTVNGSQITGFHSWNSSYDGAVSTQVALFQPKQNAWFSMTGDYLVGGEGSLTFDHHVYLYLPEHIGIRYVKTDTASKNMSYNGNADLTGGAVKYVCFDGNDVGGCQNGIDLSNTNNAWGAYDGHFDGTVIQFNKIHSEQQSTQQNGIIGYNIKNVTIRHNLMWNNGQNQIGFSNTSGYPWSPVIYCYGNKMYDGSIAVRGTQTYYMHDNVYHTQGNAFGGTGRCLEFYNTSASLISSWDCDGNIWYNPTNANPFYDAATATDITFLSWQAAGNDAEGVVSNPLWNNPATGVFVDDPVVSVDWPSAFTNLEYSTNGVDWVAYTNDSDAVIAASLSQIATVYFRATTDATNGVYQIVATTDAGSLDVVSETDSDTLTGAVTTQYLVLQFSGQSLFLPF